MDSNYKMSSLRALSSETLQRIMDAPSDQEAAKEGDLAYPLAGKVHITGIGQVRLDSVRQVLKERV